jgi:flagellar basal body-associated protein FliL
MADKAEKRAESAGGAPADKKDAKAGAGAGASHGGGAAAAGGLLTKTPVLLGGVMLLEAAVLFAGFKFLGGGPAPVAGAELAHDGAAGGGTPDSTGANHAAAADNKSFVEVEVLSFRAPNKQSGRTFLYDVSIYVVAKADKEAVVKKTFESRKALITDRVRTIIAQSDPEKLGGGSEPGLETLRRQVKYQLDEIVGEGVIEEVLVPRCIPFRTDY